MDFNKKIFAWFNIFVLLLLSCSQAVHADVVDLQEVLSFLREKFPPVYVPVGDVVQANGDRVVFTLKKGVQKIPPRGSELIVTSHEPDIPVYLQKESGIIKVVSVFKDKILGQEVKFLEKKVEKNDCVVMPASPIVYLYTNVRERESFDPYENLLQGLIKEKLDVVEIHDAKISADSAAYGVLLRMDAGNGYLTVKLQSIYSGNTFYSASLSPGADVALSSRPETGVKVDISKKHDSPDIGTDRAILPSALPGREGEEYFPLDGEYKRFVFADMDADGHQELILLNNQGIFGFKQVNDTYTTWDSFLFKGSDILAIHLHRGDMDLDGKDELLVTLVEQKEHMGKKDSALSSMVLTYASNTFAVLDDGLPFYLRTIEDREGKEIFIGQTGGEHEPYSGSIFEIRYDKIMKKVVKDQVYKPAAEVFSLYQFNLDPFNQDHLIILEPNNDLNGYYASKEKIGAISQRNYGSYEEISYPVKLKKELYSQGGFQGIGSKTVFAPRRFILKKEHGSLAFLINKERISSITRTAFKKIFGKSSAKDQILGIKWQGKKLVESWASQRIERDIIDFCIAGDYVHVLARNTNGECFISTVHPLESF